MTVTINKTDGTVLTTIADGAVDTTSTNVALIGRLYRNYGELVNENFVKLLENFANTSSPTTPIVGQLWYNTTTKSINVYRSTGFIPLARITSAAAEPSNPATADLWYDLNDEQLKIYGGATWVTLAPPYTASQTKTGAFAQTITDVTTANHIAVVIYQQNQPIAIFSKDTEYTPQVAITGFTTVKKGLTLSNITGFYLHGTATDSQLLDGLDSAQFLRSDANDTTSGTLGVQNDAGLTVGADDDIKISVSAGTGKITKLTTGSLQIIMETDTALEINNDEQVLFTDGAESTPSISFIDDTGTGIYSSTDGSIDFTSEGTKVVTIDGNGLTVVSDASINGILEVNNDVTLGNVSTQTVTLNANTVSIPNDVTFNGGDVIVSDNLAVSGNLNVDGSIVTINADISATGSTVLTGTFTVAATDVNDFKVDTNARVMINATSPATGYTNEGDVTMGATNAIFGRNVPKYVVTFDGTVSGLAILRSHHVATVTRTSGGNYSLTLRDDYLTNIPLISAYPTVIGSTNGSGYVRVNGSSSAGDTSINVSTGSDFSAISVAIWDGAN